MFECEPRQQLLWSIAGRATSMSWQSGVAAAVTPPAGAATPSLALATAVPQATPTSVPTVAAAEAVLGFPSDAALAVLPANHRSSLERSRWSELQPEMLAHVLEHAGTFLMC
jgi:hypothetical protein